MSTGTIPRIVVPKSTTGTVIASRDGQIAGIPMTADINELLAEIRRANAYIRPAGIVIRYKAITGLSITTEMPAGVTMREMLEAVVAGDSITREDVGTEDNLSGIAPRERG